MKSKLKVELLTSDKTNKSILENFSANKQGKGLEKYLKNSAWIEDISGATKVYLVKDRETGAIVFFFALQAGLLYKSIEEDDYILSEKEREIVNLCVEYRLDSSNEFTPDDVFEWYADSQLDKEKLLKIIEEKADIKLNAQQDRDLTGQDVNIMRVSETFPGIVLTHFCKNQNYTLSEKLLFPLGFYVFWEIVTEAVLHIASLLGCRYLYLFAADSTEKQWSTQSFMDYLYDDMDKDRELEKLSYRLVEYYKNEMKFEEVQGMTILKPSYDFQCFSLVQSIGELSEKKKAAWIEHSDIESSI